MSHRATRAASDTITHGTWILTAVALGALSIGALAIPGSPVHHWVQCDIHQITNISSTTAVMAGCDASSPVDAGLFTTAAPAPMPGYNAPAGTTTWASSTYSNDYPQNAIDGNLSTQWNAGIYPPDTPLGGPYSGTYILTFPQPLSLESLGVDTSASPSTNEVFTISASNNGTTWIPITSVTQYVTSNTFFSIPLPGFTQYQYLRIAINSESTWAALTELSFVPPSS